MRFYTQRTELVWVRAHLFAFEFKLCRFTHIYCNSSNTCCVSCGRRFCCWFFFLVFRLFVVYSIYFFVSPFIWFCLFFSFFYFCACLARVCISHDKRWRPNTYSFPALATYNCAQKNGTYFLSVSQRWHAKNTSDGSKKKNIVRC